MTFTLKKTRRSAPILALIHGGGGVGKSTLAASAPKSIFLASEDGLKNIDAVAVEPFPQSWDQALDALAYLADVEDCQTVAVDSLDWLEPLCWAHVCRAAKKPDIEAFGYGKGYVAALDQWRVFVHRMQTIHARGKNVVLIAHSVRKPVKNPEGDDYEQWQIKLHEKAAGLIKEWVDVVGFASHEIIVDDKSGRAKGLSTGRRVLKTQPNAGYDAKTRYGMPKSIPLDWTSFERAVRAGSVSPIERLKADLDARLAELGDPDLEKSARAYVDERGVSVSSLTDAIITIDSYLAERKKAS